MELVSSAVVEDIDDLRKRGLASLAFFYCDFRDDAKNNLRGLVSSLLVQLCDHSDPFSTILSKLYATHGDGSRQASDGSLIGCLGDILKHPDQAPVYIIIDGLDECPNTSGMPTDREKVLEFVEELVDLHLRNLRVCITSRPEVDITDVLDSLYFRTITLHEERGQIQDIVNYINSVVNTDRRMKRWRKEDRELVIEALTTKALGMWELYPLMLLFAFSTFNSGLDGCFVSWSSSAYACPRESDKPWRNYQRAWTGRTNASCKISIRQTGNSPTVSSNVSQLHLDPFLSRSL
jgi:hypothetical protein